MNRRDSVLALLAMLAMLATLATLATLALSATPAALAQAPGKVWRIGYLTHNSGPDEESAALVEQLRVLGYPVALKLRHVPHGLPDLRYRAQIVMSRQQSLEMLVFVTPCGLDRYLRQIHAASALLPRLAQSCSRFGGESPALWVTPLSHHKNLLRASSPCRYRSANSKSARALPKYGAGSSQG